MAVRLGYMGMLYRREELYLTSPERSLIVLNAHHSVGTINIFYTHNPNPSPPINSLIWKNKVQADKNKVIVPVSNDTQIETVINGEGTSIVLIPGLALDATMFARLSEDLVNNGYKVIAVNIRGTAGSIGPMENITLHDLASDVAGVIDKLSDGPAYIVGNAFGNRIARCLATDHPQLVKSLILLAAGGSTEIAPDIIEAIQILYSEEASVQEKTQAAKMALVNPDFDPKPILQLKWWPEVVKPLFTAEQATPVSDWWHGGNAPILIIQGLLDKIAPPENAHDLHNKCGDRVRLLELKNTGHALLFEQPKVVAAAIVSYISNDSPMSYATI